MKRILILAGNYYPEPTGIGKYNGEMADWLAQNGFEVAVVTTFPYYPQWKVQPPYTKRRFWFKKEIKIAQIGGCKTTIYRCPHYVPARPTGAKRMLSDVTIFLGTLLVIIPLLFSRKYDYVLTVAPPFQTGLLAILYKKLKRAETIYHIQDLQIDAAKDLGMIRSKTLLGFLFRIEQFILRHSDYLSSISLGMIKRIKTKVEAPILFLPNWVETEKFFPLTDKGSLKESFGFSPSDKIVLYSGAIGEKQGLEAILDAAFFFRNNIYVKFAICGSGPYKQKLMQRAVENDLSNVSFIALQPHERFNAFLNMADVHLVLQKAGASDLVMPSKLSTILSIGGIAIVAAQNGTGLYDYIYENNIGLLIEPENQKALEKGILNALENDHETIATNARQFAKNHLAIDTNLNSFFALITKSLPQPIPYSSTAVLN